MKSIGNTNDGNHLVEMTRDELSEFTRLHQSITGGTEFGLFLRDPTREIDFDFHNVFHVIRVFYLAKFKLNDLQNFIDEIREKINAE